MTSQAPEPLVSEADVETEVSRLFTASTPGLVIRVHGGDSASARADAFRELLDSLAMYDDRYRSGTPIEVPPPSKEDLARALSVLGKPELQRQLFQRILLTFGRHMLDPLGAILDATPGGALLDRISRVRGELLRQISDLRLTQETAQILAGDLTKLLNNDYLAMLAEHEEKVQRPRLEKLGKEVLHLIGVTFQRSFRSWPANARQIAESIHHRLGPVDIRENPKVIRQHIVIGIEDFLWVETSMELSGALEQLFKSHHYESLIDTPPELSREVYRQFAEACWELIAEFA